MGFRGGRRRLLALGGAALAALPGCTATSDRDDGGTSSIDEEAATEASRSVKGCGPGTSVDSSLPRPTDWPQFRADARNTGINLEATGPSLDHVESTDDLTEIRRFEGSNVYPPAVADGSAYFTGDGTTYAADGDDGTVRWKLGRTRRETVPTMVAGRIIEASERPRPTVSAHDPVTGCELWRVRSEDDEAATGVLAATDEAVYVNFGERLYALSPTDGAERWRIETGDGKYPSGIGATDGAVYVSGGETVYALDAADGAELWRADVRPDYEIPPGGAVIGADTVYVCTCCDRFDLVALSADAGDERWRLGEFAGRRPAVGSGRLFVTSGEAVRAFSTDGDLLWTTDLNADRGGPSGPASLAGNALYVPLGSGIATLDPVTGDVRSVARWSGEPIHSDLAVTDGALYFQTQEGGERLVERIRAITASE